MNWLMYFTVLGVFLPYFIGLGLLLLLSIIIVNLALRCRRNKKW